MPTNPIRPADAPIFVAGVICKKIINDMPIKIIPIISNIALIMYN